MDALAALLVLLASSAGMGLLMAFMGRGLGAAKRTAARASVPRPDHVASVAALKREQARVKALMERLDAAGR